MKLRSYLFICFFLALGCVLPLFSFPDNANQSRKIGLRILYAGRQGSAREKDFVNFLAKYFMEVRTAELTKFTAKQSNGCDVVILDYDREDPGNVPESLITELSKDYSRPTVTVGVTGALICGRLKLKTGYL